MLAELVIENIALIDAAQVEFGPGLNLLTGETGAGKSILIDALSLALGERASPDRVREGAPAGRVDAVFVLDPGPPPALAALLEEAGLAPDDDGRLILSREITRAGRSTARINGRPVTTSLLRQVGSLLVEVHGQGDNQTLLDPDKQLEWLDALAGDAVAGLRARLAERVAALRSVAARLRALAADPRERQRELDLLRFQMDEIDQARLAPGEEEELAARRQRLAGAERLARQLGDAYEMLYAAGSSAADRLAAAARALEDAAAIDPDLQDLAQRVRGLEYEVEEAARDVRARAEAVEHDPAALAQVEERLARLQDLKRKYGDSVDEILAYRQQVARRLAELEGAEEQVAALEAERRRILEEAGELACQLHEARRRAAERLAEDLRPVLAALGMPGASLSVAFTTVPDPAGVPWPGGPVRLTEKGVDRVEFLLAPNPGEPPRPLARAASGGERSRVMLALRSLHVAAGEVPTVIFDEVDTGVGGETAWAVGQRLALLARTRQVLCVTHLAPISALADRHLAVSKETRGGRTRTRIRLLTGDDRLRELARMLGTGPGQQGTDAARLLLERARDARRAG
ncbi:DNA repair protein RecN [Thermaerobacter marianensis DSM 12885]|uniref:DNA repair protein RecN n=1 Tax=Thermaerobacter marianensis (strain ATCC 700841 / DSM 12885 / JCM 10246 / 7p75a) TaxID=644966 RepID=E6SKR4_THEM7|nr:DNA repair protein RecN [Thermaerobacter marianensis]ADU51272.1 DNA repair protein RecN [Thermaerobacter marianensis DSM 12885]